MHTHTQTVGKTVMADIAEEKEEVGKTDVFLSIEKNRIVGSGNRY